MLEIFTERLAAESEQQRQQIIDRLLPFVILPFRVRFIDILFLTAADFLSI